MYMLASLHLVASLVMITVLGPPAAAAAAVEVVTRSGAMRSHIDVPRVGEIVGHTVLSYLESRATNPPDVLVIENTEYPIVAGLEITIPVGARHGIVSLDPASHRRYVIVITAAASSASLAALRLDSSALCFSARWSKQISLPILQCVARCTLFFFLFSSFSLGPALALAWGSIIAAVHQQRCPTAGQNDQLPPPRSHVDRVVVPASFYPLLWGGDMHDYCTLPLGN